MGRKCSVRLWTEEDMARAIAEIESSSGRSCRSVAVKYGISESVLRFRLTRLRSGKELGNPGRKPVFDKAIEDDLARCVGVLCGIGFSPTASDVKDLVQDYVRTHEISSPFRDGRPGKSWFHLFMARNGLSLKKANMISSARKSATSNPFVVYDFYDCIERIIEEKKILPGQIWNCDETSFSSDPHRCRVVSVRGQSALKVASGAGRENTTVLAACAADGKAMAPMIIFSGKNFQSTWKGSKALPDTLYGVSDSGWMTTQLFYEWFVKFSDRIEARPLLLILDGHLTHLSLDVIEKAIKENITIVKLPPHITDLLQSLDVACFGPLKRLWEKALSDWASAWGPRTPIRKSVLVDKLGEIWPIGLSEQNIKSGFEATGIYPLNRMKFPVSRLDGRLMARYERWVTEGKPQEKLTLLAASSVPTPRKAKQRASPPRCSTPRACPSTSCAEEECPPHVPGKKWIRAWALVDDKDRSFEDVILDKIKGPVDQPKQKRRKIDLKTKVITDQEYAEAVRAKEKDQKGKRRIDFTEESDKSSDSEDETMGIDSAGAVQRMMITWKEISPPALEADIVNSWFGAIFYNRKKATLYVGRAIRRFLTEENGVVEALELDCLKPHIGQGDILESVPQHLPKDIDIFPIENIISGPLDVQPIKGGKWKVDGYEKLQKTYREALHVDRKQAADAFKKQ